MEPEILIVAEHNGSELDPITFDLIAWGSQIASEKNWKVGVLVLGFQVNGLLETMRRSAVDVIFALDDPVLQDYNSCVYVQAVARTLMKTAPRLILLGHTYLGIEISGGLAAKLDATLWSNCLAIKPTPGGFLVTRPVSGGAFLSTLEIESGACNVISLQRGSSPLKELPIKFPEVIGLSVPPESDPARIKVTGETKPSFAEDITKADLLVAVGRGIGQQSRLPPFLDLAQALGGAIAASRPIVDMGWLSVDHQVGLSGVTVRPKVYLACGISGSAQHVAGMRDSRLIIAINEDPSAPIFQIAHYGIVGDIFEIVPALINEARRSADRQEKSGGTTN
ncbi:MAG: electron transfer flavoprotein subunit alpha/FixB family protein [Betaproteobacteria bacterium]|nr:electron transfer flavoprotein subunit alpha/FixB family protein [Betaproteobacteria bacterium]